MGAEERDPIADVAGAVADGTPVDWKRERGAASPETLPTLDHLSVVEQIKRVHATPKTPSGRAGSEPGTPIARDVPTPDRETKTEQRTGDSPPMPSKWGHLELREWVGGGTWGDVYRAFDPTLQVEVALKLLKPADPRATALADRFLSEARKLAKVRHPNVVAVHGADFHDDRYGIWTEFIRGQTLAAYVKERGRLGAEEATAIGLSLCRGLAAIHRAHLAHRDVKASNVMREEGGRIVLMDLGSGAEIPAGGAAPGGHVYGTPMAMAPEQLRGEIAGPATDIYGLGALLYWLVSMEYPIDASSWAEVVQRHAHRKYVSLRDRRPDLPFGFVQVVNRAIEPKPDDRYPTAGEMERALGALLGHGHEAGDGDSPTIPFWKLATAAAAFFIVVAAFVLWSRLPVWHPRSAATPPTVMAPTPAPARLSAAVALLRRSGSKLTPLPNVGGRIAPGDELAMELTGNAAMHVYVLNGDLTGKVYLLFPIPGVSPTNPLAAGVRYRLPGQMGDSLLYWVVTNPGQRDAIATIASREPIGVLEQIISQIPPAAPGRPVQYRELSPAALNRLRGIGGVKAEGTVPEDTRRQLEAAIESLSERARKMGDVWVWRIDLENPAPAP